MNDTIASEIILSDAAAEFQRVLDFYASRYRNGYFSILSDTVDLEVSVPFYKDKPSKETLHRIKSLALDAAMEACENHVGTTRPFFTGKILEALLLTQETFGGGEVVNLLLNFLRLFTDEEQLP